MSTQEQDDHNEVPPTTTAAGAHLVPDLKKLKKGVIHKWWYWIGALPGCPHEHLDVGSVDFPKMTEDVRRDSRGRTIRRAHLGSLRHLTRDQLERIRADLPQCVIRFEESEETWRKRADADMRKRAAIENRTLRDADLELSGTLEDLDLPRRKGRPIRIPTDKAIALAKQHSHRVRMYAAEEHDEPGARYVFAELCADQDRPQRRDFYPDPLEITDLEWPDEMQE